MHGLAKQANKRTDPQNRRMTARAANATSQVIPRNRSLMIWGEKKVRGGGQAKMFSVFLFTKYYI